MYPDREIVHTDRRLDNLSTIPDDLSILTLQIDSRKDAPNTDQRLRLRLYS